MLGFGVVVSEIRSLATLFDVLGQTLKTAINLPSCQHYILTPAQQFHICSIANVQTLAKWGQNSSHLFSFFVKKGDRGNRQISLDRDIVSVSSEAMEVKIYLRVTNCCLRHHLCHQGLKYPSFRVFKKPSPKGQLLHCYASPIIARKRRESEYASIPLSRNCQQSHPPSALDLQSPMLTLTVVQPSPPT